MKTRLLLPAVLLWAGIGYAQTIDLEVVANGFDRPVEITHAGDDRLFVVEQSGRIRILHPDGTVNNDPFLDISVLVSNGFEQGLLGLAFHPDYTTNGYFFINYTDEDGDTVVARYTVDDENPDLADADSSLPIITVNQPFDNHNGGTLRFGPEGYLYIGMGDGGSGDDPQGNAQNVESLLGKMLRLDIDTDGEMPYEIPADNPFAGVAGADEIWAYGLRNPWKFSFAHGDFDLWIADVGQDELEEINMAEVTQAGLNYGWRCYEGTQENITDGCPNVTELTMPIAEYGQANSRCSITGGFLYSGEMYPNLVNKYVFGDWCSGEIGITDSEGDITWTDSFNDNIYTFGEDMNGELYVGGGETVYRIVDTSLSTPRADTMPFAVYPNPADNDVFIDMRDTADVAVTIYDMGGKLLVMQPVSAEISRIDTSALQAGIYVMEIKAGDTSYNQKLVIR